MSFYFVIPTSHFLVSEELYPGLSSMSCEYVQGYLIILFDSQIVGHHHRSPKLDVALQEARVLSSLEWIKVY